MCYLVQSSKWDSLRGPHMCFTKQPFIWWCTRCHKFTIRYIFLTILLCYIVHEIVDFSYIVLYFYLIAFTSQAMIWQHFMSSFCSVLNVNVALLNDFVYFNSVYILCMCFYSSACTCISLDIVLTKISQFVSNFTCS